MAVKSFKRAMRELVRLADKKMDISNARAEAVQCAREATAMAEADEETARPSLMQRVRNGPEHSQIQRRSLTIGLPSSNAGKTKGTGAISPTIPR